jgi:glutamate racemase
MDPTAADKSPRPIAVFDSGLGGLTVVRQIARRLPGREIVYLGDSARVPYGIKSPETIRRFALQDQAFLTRFDPAVVVVACNTASAVALDILKARSADAGAPVVGMVAPAAEEAVRLSVGRPIGVIGTEATIASGAYQQAIGELDDAVEVHAAAAPLLVPIVEEGRPEDDPIVLHVLGDYLRRLQRVRPAVLILGCTHYPLLAGAIGKLMGPDAVLLDTGAAAAEKVRLLLGEAPAASAGECPLRCYSTDNPRRFARLAGRFLGREVREVAWVGTDELDAMVPGGCGQ